MLQNKANGLFVRADYPSFFSAAPSLFQQRAIGAGANVLYGRNVLGNTDSYGYLYARGTANSLITWSSNTLGTNSMFMIEEVEDVTEEPTTAYTVKMWPGYIHTYTMPVDVKVVEGATAYDATLQLNENDTTVVLKSLPADETIAHGTPFVLIANSDNDYATPAAMLDALKEEKKAELGVTTLTDSIVQALEEEVQLAYMYVSMEHGTSVSAEVHEQQGLTGVMEGFTAKAGKAVVAKENGFAHTKQDTYIAGYSAYIATDFDATGADVQGTITIKIGDDSETGINEVLNKVAKNNATSYSDDHTKGYINNLSTYVLKTNWTQSMSEFQQVSDMFLENASFFRLDDINAGYTFDKIKNWKGKIRVGASVQNVFAITNYSGLDPELTVADGVDNNLIPRPRLYTLRLNINF